MQDKKRKVEEKKQESVKERETRKREEEEQNKYLVADMPVPGGKLKRARREKDANTAVLAEFGLNLLLSVLRKRTSRYRTTRTTHVSHCCVCVSCAVCVCVCCMQARCLRRIRST